MMIADFPYTGHGVNTPQSVLTTFLDTHEELQPLVS
jgi:hypothetical protein